MKKRVKKRAILVRPSPGFMGVALLATLITVSPVHAGWLVEDQKLVASDAAERDYFGKSISVDGDTAVVGATGGDGGGLNSGAAYIFVRNGAVWSQQAKLMASDAAPSDGFGHSVAISSDTVVVGAPYADDLVEGVGSAYIYSRSGAAWSQQKKLTASDPSRYLNFGRSVAISGDTVVVGAPSEPISVVGRAHVFVRNGANWIEQAKLMGSRNHRNFDRFGAWVGISNDTIVVGAPFTVSGHGQYLEKGDVFVFARNGTTWSQQAILSPSFIGKVDYRMRVAVSGDTVLMGLFPYANTLSDLDGAVLFPSVHIFTRSGSTWSEQAKLVASDEAVGDGFGQSVSISGDTAMVGAWRGNDPSFVGAAYVFDLTCDATHSIPSNQWRQISLPCDPGVNNTVTKVFGDDITGIYGTNWFVYRYDANGYVPLTATDSLSQGVGYWIIQASGSEITLDMPDNSTPTPVISNKAEHEPIACLDLEASKGCFEIPLVTKINSVKWNMIGYPFATTGGLGNARIQTDSGTCASEPGCDLDAAQSQGIIHNQLWSYNGAGYTKVDPSGNLKPWGGYWAATLDQADGTTPKLLIPRL